MLNFILGFASGIYIGTYHNETCKPIMNRLLDCMKKEFNKSLNDLEEHSSKEDNPKDN